MSVPNRSWSQARRSVSRLAGRVRAPLRDDELHARVGELGERVAALEADLAEAQRLNLRLAELTDVVTDLLVPLASGDPERARAVLEKYADELGS